MDWVKLSTGYYRDPKVMRAGEQAELLFTRGLAYCGEQETSGHIPREALAMICPVKPMPRVTALVREGLWTEVADGWVVTAWNDRQDSLEQLTARRVAGRRRAAEHRTRTRNGVRNAVTNGARDADVTGGEKRREEETAAAAAQDAAAAALPTSIEILRNRLQAHTALRGLRFDGLAADKVEQLTDLIALHGDHTLVDTAIRTLRTPPPVHVAAFLGTWAALPAPGRTLAIVSEPECDIHVGQTARTCRGCAADRLAGDA